ncbi:unnamed protein product [Leptidea sinapis]|uniref:Uncharacterized protein n=1 Tax=Leptidea sinapis TaxID=189913 RepID=A0A5E4QUE8_9NEOP|nr:unnamed protein product [Leptidea sinapis]
MATEYKRRSMLRDSQTETESSLLRAASAMSVASGATDRSGNTDCVEEYVCDVPFAGYSLLLESSHQLLVLLCSKRNRPSTVLILVKLLLGMGRQFRENRAIFFYAKEILHYDNTGTLTTEPYNDRIGNILEQGLVWSIKNKKMEDDKVVRNYY